MVELMEYLYAQLSKYGEVFWEDLERDNDGKAIIDDVKIVYNIPNILNLTDNKCRLDMSLNIDIWGFKYQNFKIEELITKMNRLFKDEIYRSDTLCFIISKDNLFRINHNDEDKNIRRVQLNYIIRFYQ